MSDSENTSEIESQSETVTPSRSRSRSRSQRPNYRIDDAGLNNSEDEEEYKETGEDDAVDDDDDDDDKAGDVYEEEEEEEEEEEVVSHRRSKRKLRDSNAAEEEEEEEEEGNADGTNEGEDELEDDDKTSSEKLVDHNAIFHINKKMKLSYPVDANGDTLPVVNDEYALPDDPSGEEKIDKDGNLQGNRKFKVRSFKLFDNGDRKFMLATEPARAVGLRDSSALFQYHPNMYKYVLTQSEKNKLIGQGILPYSYRNRTIAVVTARSVFKEFGHTMIVDGKENDDDYYSDPKLRNSNVKEGQAPKEKKSSKSHSSNKNKKHNTNQHHQKHGHHPLRHTEKQDFIETAQLQSSANPARNTVEFFQSSLAGNAMGSNSNSGRNDNIESIVSTSGGISSGLMGVNGGQLNATNWLYQHAAACSRYNSDMYYDRVRILLIESQGIRDPYTNTLHIPQGTQSTKVVRYQKVEDQNTMRISGRGVEYETVIRDKDVLKPVTGLTGVPKEIYEGIVDAETLKAIEEQKLFETGL